jgi:nuclear pore complex protein Nup210
MRHLLIHYPFAKQVWLEALAWLRLSCRTPRDTDDSIFTWLVEAKQTTPKPLRKGLGSAALLLPWMIWKHRNECVFEGARPSVRDLMSKFKEEAALWAKAGAMGLRVALPATWDVH